MTHDSLRYINILTYLLTYVHPVHPLATPVVWDRCSKRMPIITECRMSLSHQSVFNNPVAAAGVPGYYGSYNHYTDFYGDHLDITHHQTPTHHQHGPYTGFPAASYGMLTALQGGAGGGSGAGAWYDPGGIEPPNTAGFCRFDLTGNSTAFRRLPVSAATIDVKPETAVARMAESGTGRSGGRSACRELNSDADVSFFQ